MEPLLQEMPDILPLLTLDFKKVSRATSITAAAAANQRPLPG